MAAPFGDHTGQEVLGPTETGFRQEDVIAIVPELHLVPATGVIGGHPVHLARSHAGPEGLPVRLVAQGWVHLSTEAADGVIGSQQVPDGHLPSVVDVGECGDHAAGRIEGFADDECSRLMFGRAVSWAK